MSALELLSRLRALGMSVTAQAAQLRVKGPPGALTEELRKELTARKDEVLKLLREVRVAGSLQSATIPRTTGGGDMPLSYAQGRVWFLDQLEPGSFTYNIPAAFRLTGQLDAGILERSLGEIVRRHGTLRTMFFMIKGESRQRICEWQPFRLAIDELQGMPAEQREEEAKRLSFLEARQPFDLGKPPLIRARLLKLAERDHILLVNMHHIASDAWSFGIFTRELGVIYEALVLGRPSPLPELSIQYVDFAVWQRQWLRGHVLESQLAYWKKQLAGSLPCTDLPSDLPRPAVQTPNGASESIVLPKSLVGALKALSRREGVTLFITLLASFKAFLHRFTGQHDILVGTPVANRQRVDIEGLIGFFVNTLVLRTDLSGNPTFRELLSRVREVALGAYAHQDVPFEKLVSEFRPERSMRHAPLFQVMFNFWNTPTPLLELPGLDPSRLQYHDAGAKVDLSLAFEETAQGLTAWCLYNTDLWDKSGIIRMLGNLRTLLEGTAANPDQRLADLPLLTSAERQQVLVEWNRTDVAYPKDRCLHQLVEAQADRTPQAIAVAFKERSLTYRQLSQRANQLARHLQKLGVGPDTLVGISLERSLEMVIGLLGILKAGGAYVPMDPEYPKERLAFMLQDAGVSVLLTHSPVEGLLPAHSSRIVRLDADWPAIAAESPDHLPSLVTARNLAYMIYTSGSTGQPKGAMNTHMGIVNRLLWMQDTYRLTSSDRVLQKTPFSFDVSVWEFFWPLMTGARLVVAQPGGHKDGAYIADLIAKEKITTLHFVPSMLRAFLQQGGLKSSCASLKRVICSGEELSVELEERFFLQLAAELHNLYGPTEAAVDATSWACERGSARRTVPIGRPIANTRIYILDKELQPVPVGVAGELHIGGIAVGRGYLHRPELTAERFIGDPFASDPEARLYKTGDLARYLQDGNIEYLGRMDEQVKVRGFRIELGEVEAALTQHSAVREAVVTAREDSPGDKRLVAYVVAQNAAIPPAELRLFLQEKLPDYMVPATFVMLDTMPLAPNGKLDRRSLPVPGPRQPEFTTPYAIPGSRTEGILAEIWSKTLGLEKVGVHDNFFDLGGNSLLLMVVQARIGETLNAQVSIAEMFQYPTISLMARHLDQPATAVGRLEKVQQRARRQTQALARPPGMKGRRL